MSIQSFILSRWASASSSGLLAYSGLKWDQFNCGLCGTSGTIGASGIKGLRGMRDSDLEVDFDLGLDFDFDSDFDFNFDLEAVQDLLCLPLFFFTIYISLCIFSFSPLLLLFFLLPCLQDMYIFLYV